MSNFVNSIELIKEDYESFEDFVDESINEFARYCNNGLAYAPYKGFVRTLGNKVEADVNKEPGFDFFKNSFNIINVRDRSCRDLFINVSGPMHINAPSCGLVFVSIISGIQNVELYEIYQLFQNIKFTLVKTMVRSTDNEKKELLSKLSQKELQNARIVFCSKTQNLFNMAVRYSQYSYEYFKFDQTGKSLGNQISGANFALMQSAKTQSQK